MRRPRGRRVMACLGAFAAILSVSACGGQETATPTGVATSAANSGSTAANGGGAVTTSGSTATSGGSSGPSAFDPCGALTPRFLAQHRWDARPPRPRRDVVAGSTWQGCLYVAASGYTFRVQTTDATLAAVREKFPTAAATVGDRKALRYEARPDVPGGCTVDIEMKSGSLDILLDDPRGTHPRGLSPCDNALEIAEAVAPLLPAGS